MLEAAIWYVDRMEIAKEAHTVTGQNLWQA